MHDGAIKIRIASPAVENAANRALIIFIAQQLDIPNSRVRIVSGISSRRKIVTVDGITADVVTATLRKAEEDCG